MHSPASKIDKDPYELKCHLRAQGHSGHGSTVQGQKWEIVLIEVEMQNFITYIIGWFPRATFLNIEFWSDL